MKLVFAFRYRNTLIISYINDVVIKIVYRLIAKDNRNAHCISVVSLTQNILILFISNYRKNCKSDNASRDIFIIDTLV